MSLYIADSFQASKFIIWLIDFVRLSAFVLLAG